MIATVTLNPYLEYFLQVDRLPANVDIPAKGTLSALGGVGLNVARVLRRLDPALDARAFGFLGGNIGALIKAELSAEGVPHDFVDTGLEPRLDVSLILATDRSRVHVQAPGPELEEKHAKELTKKLTTLDPAPAFMVLGGGMPGRKIPPPVPRDYYSQLITDLRKKPNIKVVLDAAGAELGHAVERGPFLVKPSGREMAVLAGRKELDSDKDYLVAAEDLMRRYNVGVFVISLGKAGAIVASKDKHFKVIPPEVEANSSRGSGAAMLAGILAGLSAGKDLEEACALGAAAGAARAAVRTSVLPTGDEIRKQLAGVRTERI